MHIARFGVIKHNGKHSLSASGQKHHANCYALCGYNLWFCNPIHVPMVLCWRKKMNTRKPVFEFPISSFIHFLCCSHLPTGNSGVFLEATGGNSPNSLGNPGKLQVLISSGLQRFSDLQGYGGLHGSDDLQSYGGLHGSDDLQGYGGLQCSDDLQRSNSLQCSGDLQLTCCGVFL